jgi:uncharacterized protein YqjF (DUF2071 family)
MHQRWENLLFLCWIVRPAGLQRTLAEGLRVHTRDGNAHFGLSPFFLRDLHPPGYRHCFGFLIFSN